jgi:acylglycerol lipase
VSQVVADRWALADGTVFRVLQWKAALPDAESELSKTLLLIHHGIGEHAGRYEGFVRSLELPMPAAAYDVRGHGHTAGKRGDAAGLDGLVDDFEALLPRFIDAANAERVLLYAHSMGGAVVARYLTHRRVHPAICGVVMSAPAVAVEKSLAMRVKLRVGRVLKRVAPTFTLPTGLATDGISSDPDEVQAYVDDPLNHDRVSLRLADSLLSEGPEAIAWAGNAKVPALIVHGEEDPIIPLEGSRALSAAWGAPCEVSTFPGGRHELHHEVPAIRAAHRDAVRNWLMEHATR